MATPPPDSRPRRAAHAGRRVSTETKASFKTSELAVLIVLTVAILIASAVVGDSNRNGVNVDLFRASQAWWYITVLGAAYMIGRGLAKSGSRQFYDDYGDLDRDRHPDSTAGTGNQL